MLLGAPPRKHRRCCAGLRSIAINADELFIRSFPSDAPVEIWTMRCMTVAHGF